ncbi:MAG: H-NS family nucleoid-associated regulatory protein [Methylocystis sp.]|uniref:H-NS histone family protein n=1 Tax=Methylocystis sp. TaxID=1911079 RepID=UPI003DA251E3
MSDEFANLSDLEIMSLIHRANEELARRKDAQRETLRADIEQKLRTAGLDLADLFPELDGKSSSPVASKTAERAPRATAPKYRNHVSGDTWSGRGAHPPQWVKSILMERGWTIEEFKASTEFLA